MAKLLLVYDNKTFISKMVNKFDELTMELQKFCLIDSLGISEYLFFVCPSYPAFFCTYRSR